MMAGGVPGCNLKVFISLQCFFSGQGMMKRIQLPMSLPSLDLMLPQLEPQISVCDSIPSPGKLPAVLTLSIKRNSSGPSNPVYYPLYKKLSTTNFVHPTSLNVNLSPMLLASFCFCRLYSNSIRFQSMNYPPPQQQFISSLFL